MARTASGPDGIMAKRLIVAVLPALLLGAAAPGAHAQEGVITRSEALAAVYPDATVTRDRVILTREQMGSVAALARVGMQGRIFPRYVARDEDGAVVGRAYIDTHTPKTERQSLLISLDTAGRVIRVDVTVFFEPAQYMAPQDWLRQFDGAVLEEGPQAVDWRDVPLAVEWPGRPPALTESWRNDSSWRFCRRCSSARPLPAPMPRRASSRAARRSPRSTRTRR